MFQGAHSLNLDAKGRLSIPARHRDALSAAAHGPVTLTKHPHGCLMLFPRPAWEQFRQRVAQLPMSAHWWKRIFLGQAHEVEPDAAGRVLVAPELRDFAGISREVVLMGMGDYFELWDKAVYAAKEAEAMTGEMPEVLSDFSF